MSNKVGRPVGIFKGKYPKRVGGKLTRGYTKWVSMKQRCSNKNHPGYVYYGGRGIKVCERWTCEDGFDNFIDDLGHPPDGLTLERIDNDKGYEPGNVRWATWAEQAKNKRKKGTTVPLDRNSLRQRAIRAGLPYMVVYLRIKRLGWKVRRALTTPKLPRTKHSLSVGGAGGV